eukprot:2283098-Amphidinium_carterae.1
MEDDGGSEQEEEDHEERNPCRGFPTGRFLGTENYLQTPSRAVEAGDNLQKWVELEVNHAKAPQELSA